MNEIEIHLITGEVLTCPLEGIQRGQFDQLILNREDGEIDVPMHAIAYTYRTRVVTEEATTDE